MPEKEKVEIVEGLVELNLQGWFMVEFKGSNPDQLANEVYNWLHGQEDEIIAFEIQGLSSLPGSDYRMAVKVRKRLAPARA